MIMMGRYESCKERRDFCRSHYTPDSVACGTRMHGPSIGRMDKKSGSGVAGIQPQVQRRGGDPNYGAGTTYQQPSCWALARLFSRRE